MQNAFSKRRFASILLSAAMLYGSIFVAKWLAPEACATDFWPPSVHCRWDLYRY